MEWRDVMLYGLGLVSMLLAAQVIYAVIAFLFGRDKW